MSGRTINNEEFDIDIALDQIQRQVNTLIFRYPGDPIHKSISERIKAIKDLWDGYYASYDRFLDIICKAWPDEKVGYDQDPFELITRLIEERDKEKC